MRVIGQVCDFSTRDVESCSNDIATHLTFEAFVSYKNCVTCYSSRCLLSRYWDLSLNQLWVIKALWLIPSVRIIHILWLVLHSVVSYRGIVTYHSFCCEFWKYCGLSFILSWVIQIMWLIIRPAWVIKALWLIINYVWSFQISWLIIHSVVSY